MTKKKSWFSEIIKNLVERLSPPSPKAQNNHSLEDMVHAAIIKASEHGKKMPKFMELEKCCEAKKNWQQAKLVKYLYPLKIVGDHQISMFMNFPEDIATLIQLSISKVIHLHH